MGKGMQAKGSRAKRRARFCKAFRDLVNVLACWGWSARGPAAVVVGAGWQASEAEGRFDCAVCRLPAVPCCRMFCSVSVPRGRQTGWSCTWHEAGCGTLGERSLGDDSPAARVGGGGGGGGRSWGEPWVGVRCEYTATKSRLGVDPRPPETA